jgi:hypothetical protein
MDGQFCFLLNYKDDGAKIYANAALTSKSSMSVAFGLLSIFALIDPPGILGADNGREFSGVASSSAENRQKKKTKKAVVDGTEVELTDAVRHTLPALGPLGDAWTWRIRCLVNESGDWSQLVSTNHLIR